MASRAPRTRRILFALTALAIGAAVTAAFWPRAVMVDIGEVSRGPMQVTIDEEGRTRVHDAYIVSTPVAGRLLRVGIAPGEAIAAGAVVAQMRPTDPAALDLRTREQSLAAVDGAEAALRVARAELNAAIAAADLARSDLERTRKLAASGTASPAALERAQGAARAAEARRETAEAIIAVREAELANARAQLIGFDDLGLAAAVGATRPDDRIPLHAPIDGRVLRIIQQSETILPAGAPVIEIGDVRGDLEVVAELISSDAVQVSVGDPVIIDDWGGPEDLAGTVTRIDPFGVTRFSALGVEEQRVSVTIGFTGPPDARQGLGHGYRVRVRIVVWRDENALRLPAAALFRKGEDWAVLRIVEGRAVPVRITVGRNNGEMAEVIEGLDTGDRVVLYPPADLAPGAAVAQRRVE